ncbi:metallophosphoesterase [Streptomyces sp. NPDC001985]|uniref:metallophosphoesterase n=1 Tax=Streptomyces sp. NPDC001985 TaxID=3154406 RepID=UPI00331F4B2D
MVVVLLVMVAVIAVLAGAHWYVWRRLVHDTTRGGGAARRAGTVAILILPVLSIGALVSGRAGFPFRVQQILAWPGFLWLVVLLYLVLWLGVGEVVRALWLRRDRRRPAAPAASGDGARRPPARPADSVSTPGSSAGPESGPASPSGPETSAGPASAPASPSGPAPSSGFSGPAPAPVSASASGPASESAPGPVLAGTTDPTAPAPTSTPTPTPANSLPTCLDTPSAGGSAEVKAEASPGAPDAGRALSRRLFVSRAVGAGAAAAALATVGHGTHSVLRGPRIKRVTVPLAKLPRSAHGLRIAVVSDIHLGPILGRGHTRRIVDTINSAQPDLVAIVGDMVDGTVADLGTAAEPLRGLRARHGSFFVTGNHEYYSGADEWVDHVRELGLRPLENERVEIAGGFDLAGVNDIEGENTGQGPDFVRALGDRDRSRASVLLAHQPVVIHDAVDHGVDLQLSGHTHGGQLWPGNHLAALANPTVAGLERYGDTQLYVSRGAGAWGPPVRVGASSDITIVQLASRQA